MKSKEEIEKFIIKSLKKINKRYYKLLKKKNLFEQGFASLDYLNLIFILEKKYNLIISSKYFSKIQSIEKITRYIYNKLWYF